MSKQDENCDKATCGTDSKCAGCSKNPNEKHKQPIKKELPHNIKKVFAVVSGKGGVGKSTVTALLASALKKQDVKVGIMDADITGPSIPRLFGISYGIEGTDEQMLPKSGYGNIPVMSLNLLVEKEDEPVIWRGPMLGGIINQFWENVLWGELDVLLIDMPPGTSDVPLTVYQTLPIDGIIVVTTPQDMVGMIVRKAVNMARKMDIPVLGVIENMSYVQCPDCSRKIYIFGESKVDKQNKLFQLPVLAQLPLREDTAHLCDTGRVFDVNMPELEGALSVFNNN